MNILKENQRIFIVSGILFIALFLIILVLSIFAGKDKHLVFECKNEVTGVAYPGNQILRLYDDNNSKKFVIELEFFVDKPDKKDDMNIIINIFQKQVESSINSLYDGETSDITISVKESSKGINFIVEYLINEENSAKMFTILNTDMWNTPNEEIMDMFSQGGFVCK